jgi:hypothetical protein
MVLIFICTIFIIIGIVVMIKLRRQKHMPQGVEIYNENGRKILSTEHRLTRSLMCVPCTSWTGSVKITGKQDNTSIYIIPFVSVLYNGQFPTTKFIKTWVSGDIVYWEYTRINNHFFDNDTLAIILSIGEY